MVSSQRERLDRRCSPQSDRSNSMYSYHPMTMRHREGRCKLGILVDLCIARSLRKSVPRTFLTPNRCRHVSSNSASLLSSLCCGAQIVPLGPTDTVQGGCLAKCGPRASQIEVAWQLISLACSTIRQLHMHVHIPILSHKPKLRRRIQHKRQRVEKVVIREALI